MRRREQQHKVVFQARQKINRDKRRAAAHEHADVQARAARRKAHVLDQRAADSAVRGVRSFAVAELSDEEVDSESDVADDE
jgi:hypothetical protein